MTRRKLQGTSSTKTTTVNTFGNDFEMILKGYIEDIKEAERKDVQAAARLAKKEVKKEPAGAGKWHDWADYSSGWSATTKADIEGYTAEIKNKKKPGLTHLLEKGHVNADGSRARAFPHVEPAAEKGAEELRRRLKGK